MKPARRLGWILSLLAVAAFAGLGWGSAFGDGWAKATVIVLFSASITLVSVSSNRTRDRLLISLLGPILAWVVVILAASVMTLAKFGHFEEGGPVGLALVFSFYLGLPIAILTWILTLLTWRAPGPPLAGPGERS